MAQKGTSATNLTVNTLTNSGLARRHDRELKALRAVASLELSKGLIVMLAGFGVLSLRHHDVWGIADSLLSVLHISPDRHFAKLFLDWADKVTDARLLTIAVVAMAYSLLRLVEAYGLWRELTWAEWLALISGALYVPFEVWDLVHKPTWIRAAILTVNLLVVAYMAYLRVVARKRRLHPAGGTLA